MIGEDDGRGLTVPCAYVVLKAERRPSPALATELREFVRARAAAFKTPARITFVADLPKTATGKIQRFRLRAPATR